MEPITRTIAYEGRDYVCHIFEDVSHPLTISAQPGKVFLCSGYGPPAMIVASGYLQAKGHVRFSETYGCCCRLRSAKSPVWAAAWDFFIQKINEMWQAARDGAEIPRGGWQVPHSSGGGS